jgi:hypothetical protein
LAPLAPRLLLFAVEAFIMRLKFVASALALFVGMLLTTSLSFAKKEYTAKEKKACAFCHKTAAPKDGKDLTAAGEYYKTNKTLRGYVKK